MQELLREHNHNIVLCDMALKTPCDFDIISI